MSLSRICVSLCAVAALVAAKYLSLTCWQCYPGITASPNPVPTIEVRESVGCPQILGLAKPGSWLMKGLGQWAASPEQQI